VASFVPFTVGAAIPMLPFVFFSGTRVTVLSIAASAAGLFLLGSTITLLTHRGGLRSGMRQLAVGLAAAGLTFAIGRLVGVGIV
jgi:vacuolar iron transporter family protein